MADNYHQLGNIAVFLERPEDAQEWCLKSLAIREDLGDRPGMATSCGQLGLLAEYREQPHQAFDWFVQCATMSDSFHDPMTAPHLARLTAQLGAKALETSWRKATGGPLPRVVRDYVSSYQLPSGEEG
jgi:hypothetical protein